VIPAKNVATKSASNEYGKDGTGGLCPNTASSPSKQIIHTTATRLRRTFLRLMEEERVFLEAKREREE
jgi:hypothetical protein